MEATRFKNLATQDDASYTAIPQLTHRPHVHRSMPAHSQRDPVSSIAPSSQWPRVIIIQCETVSPETTPHKFITCWSLVAWPQFNAVFRQFDIIHRTNDRSPVQRRYRYRLKWNHSWKMLLWNWHRKPRLYEYSHSRLTILKAMSYRRNNSLVTACAHCRRFSI